MNLKHFYYRDYFEGINFKQPKKDVLERDDKNAIVLRAKNARLLSTAGVPKFRPKAEITGLVMLSLRVKNPGLLPGIGYPHEVGYAGEFKLGFGFDHVTGLPVLPGSSVKGVLRSVFPQFEFDPERPLEFRFSDDPKKLALQRQKAKFIAGLLASNLPEAEANRLAHALELSIFEGYDVSNFSAERRDPKLLPLCKRDSFLDAMPSQFAENQLLGRDALTPHNESALKNPVPLPFVKVMPGVEFTFSFRLFETRLPGGTPVSVEQKREIFARILTLVGAGAKTNVGYGQFESTEKAATARPSSEGQSFAAPMPVAPAKTAKYEFKKSLLGKRDIVGRVVSAGASPVRFQIENIEGFEGEVEVKVPDALLERFTAGTRFHLTVFEVNVEKKVLKVKIENFKPLP